MSEPANKKTEFFEHLGPELEPGKPYSVPPKVLRHQLEAPALGPQEEPHERPRCRAECPPMPCPWVSCRWNLYLDVSESGSLHLNFPKLDVDQVPNNCVLELAERGGMTLEQIGQVMNVTRERVRQIETSALAKLRSAGLEAPEDGPEFVYPERPWHGGAKTG